MIISLNMAFSNEYTILKFLNYIKLYKKTFIIRLKYFKMFLLLIIPTIYWHLVSELVSQDRQIYIEKY